ncbi:MAG: T9SS type A sorting domain-containing protein, partial [Bacteroidetes bacterium]|nr:T9SS type A sorting domain-containing protein [Bacteroidota bacterium]
QNYPNPFNPTTTIGFTLEGSGMTTLIIYDVLGKQVRTIVNEQLESGVYHLRTFDASDLSSGVYVARLSSSGRTQIKRMLLLK